MCLHIHSATAARVEYPAAQLRYKSNAPSACCGAFDYKEFFIEIVQVQLSHDNANVSHLCNRIVIFYVSEVFDKVNTNSVPTPSVLITSMVSPCAVIISFVIDNPSPVPFLSFPRDRSVL